MPAPAVSSNTGIKRYSLRRLIAFNTANTESPCATPLVSMLLSPFMAGLAFLGLDGIVGIDGICGAVHQVMCALGRFPRARKTDFQAAEITSARQRQWRKVVYVLAVERRTRKQRKPLVQLVVQTKL